MKPKELKSLVGMVRELVSSYDETAYALGQGVQGANRTKLLLGRPVFERDKGKLLKLGLDVMHFPGFVRSIFLNEFFPYKFLGVSLVAIGLIQEKRSPMQAVDVYENFRETVQKLHRMTSEMV